MGEVEVEVEVEGAADGEGEVEGDFRRRMGIVAVDGICVFFC